MLKQHHSCSYRSAQGQWWVKGWCVQRRIWPVPEDCDLITGSLLLESTSFSCSSPGNKSAECGRAWAPLSPALPCTAFPPAHPFRPGVAQPLVFCFLFHPLFHITLFFLCFLSHLTCPGPPSSQMGGTGFTLPASADSELPRIPLGL